MHLLKKYLKVFGAVCIEGPKWCGKTWTSSYHANSEFLVGDPMEENFFTIKTIMGMKLMLLSN